MSKEYLQVDSVNMWIKQKQLRLCYSLKLCKLKFIKWLNYSHSDDLVEQMKKIWKRNKAMGH
jgi:hypothetical protein